MRVVTLLTDFGTADTYVAEMKAVLLQHPDPIAVVDVTHAIPLGDIEVGRYLLHRIWRRFPAGTIHLVVVDPGVGGSRRAVAVESAGRFAVGPDNGVLTPALDDASVVELAVPLDAAPTFHGRDVFAPAVLRLLAGDAVTSLGAPVSDPIRLSWPEPVQEDDVWLGEVVYVDHFGTLVTNLRATALPGDVLVEVSGHDVGPLRRTFADVSVGTALALVGSGGMVEIAVRDGSAAERFSLGIGSRVRVWSASD